MKTFIKLLCVLSLVFILFQCNSDEEVLPKEDVQKKPNYSDTLKIKNGSSKADDLSVIGDKSNETDACYDGF